MNFLETRTSRYMSVSGQKLMTLIILLQNPCFSTQAATAVVEIAADLVVSAQHPDSMNQIAHVLAVEESEMDS